MSSTSIPYHLRQNKAIDRNLFVELLSMINRYLDIRDYEYVSMGGPFLEDFKVIHSNTGITKMKSFEINANTFQRQKFNRPLSCIELYNADSAQFIHGYQFDFPCIVWLDFTTPARLPSDLADVHTLVSKLKSGDVVKITVNAHSASITSEKSNNPLELRNIRFQYLQDQLGEYLPDNADAEMVTASAYPRLLLRVLELIVDRAVGTVGSSYFQPLTSYVYADGQKMLTFCGILLERDETKKFLSKTRIDKWDLATIKRSGPIPIQVPDLSVKERMFLDSLLPKFSARTLQRRLRHLVADADAQSQEGLENYVRYYKQFPYYSKVIY